MHKNRVYFLLFVFCFLNNNLSASADDSAPRTYDQQKTEQMKKIIDSIDAAHFYQPTTGQQISHKVKKTLRIKEPTIADKAQQIQKLIEQGADPEALRLLNRRSGLDSAVALPNPRITEICLLQGCNPNADLKHIYPSTPLLTLCETSQDHAHLLQNLALLRFFCVDITTKDHQGNTARNILLKKQPARIADFDATIAATDVIRNLKKAETDTARLPLLRMHLPVVSVIGLVNEFSDDACWDETCLPTIQAFYEKNRASQKAKNPEDDDYSQRHFDFNFGS